MIYLHIGQEKTGSTAIQSFLNELQAQNTLSKEKFFYAKFLNKKNSMPLALFANGFTSDNVSRPYFKDEEGFRLFSDKIKSRLEAIKKKTTAESKIVFSSEHFHAKLRTKESIARLHNILTHYFPEHEIKVILYIREQKALWQSLHSESVKGSNKSGSPPMPGTNVYFDHVSNHLRVIGQWAEEFQNKNIIVRIYERKLLKENDSIIDFCETINLQIHPERVNYLKKIIDSNTLTLTGHALKVKAMLNRSSNSTLIPYNKEVNESLVEVFGVTEQGLGNNLIKAINNQNKDANEQIRKKYFPNQQSLFSQGKYDIPQTGTTKNLDNISTSEWIELILTIIQKIKQNQSDRKSR